MQTRKSGDIKTERHPTRTSGGVVVGGGKFARVTTGTINGVVRYPAQPRVGRNGTNNPKRGR